MHYRNLVNTILAQLRNKSEQDLAKNIDYIMAGSYK